MKVQIPPVPIPCLTTTPCAHRYPLPFPSIPHSVAHVYQRRVSVRERRLRLGYGLNRFAARVGVSASHLSRVERGLRCAQPEVKRRIAQGLGTTIRAIRWETEGNDE